MNVLVKLKYVHHFRKSANLNGINMADNEIDTWVQVFTFMNYRIHTTKYNLSFIFLYMFNYMKILMTRNVFQNVWKHHYLT